MASETEIAIVGIGCNFPGGEGIDSFWKVIMNSRNCTREIPPERFKVKEWYDPGDNKPGKIRTTHAALLDEFNAFDNKLFGINNEEAEWMDPRRKLLLECTYRALEDAGLTTENISGSRTGVFVGLMNQDYEVITSRAASKMNRHGTTERASSTAANQISCTFNLTGPSLDIDTASTSFLSALHFGYKAIKQGDCEAAVCAGVDCIIDPGKFVAPCESKRVCDGISKPSSRKGAVYGRGEGCGVLLLKPLIKAMEEFNKIWGVINVSAINQNGSLVTPVNTVSKAEQEKLLLSIYPTHVDPSAIQYVETCSMGSPAEDAAEAECLGNIIGTKRPSGLPPLKIGSLSGNIGYTESAAGAAAVIKVLLMMHHGKIAPSLDFSERTISSINAKKLNLSIPTGVEQWDESCEFGRVAGINCFGLGGNNAHVVVKQVKRAQLLPSARRPFELFVISAASGHSLRMAMSDTARHVSTRNSITLANLAYTSACRRRHENHRHRRAFVTSTLQHLQQQLTSAAEVEATPSEKPPQLIFVFSNTGLGFKGICKILLRSEPVFRDKCVEIKQLFQQLSPTGILELTESDHKDLSKPDLAQPLFFTMQVALVTLLKHWGIKPAAALGHSEGEVSAAHCAGLISLEDAVKIVYHRSRLQAKVSGGRMLVVSNIPVQEVSAAVDAYSGKVCVAAINSPLSCTLSGEVDSIDALQKHLAEVFSKRNVLLNALSVPVAFHSHRIDPVLPEMAASLPELKKGKLDVDLLSTASGKAVSNGDFVTGQYWARQARGPVCFADAILASAKGKDNIAFVEIGLDRELQRYITETLGPQTRVLHSMHMGREYVALLNMVKDLFELGLPVDWQNFYEGYQSVPSAYPRYHFEHKPIMSSWNMNQPASNREASSNHPLLCRTNAENSELICNLSESLAPYLYEHKSHAVVSVPCAFFTELALAAVIASSRPKVPVSFCQMNIAFTGPCVLNESPHDLKVRVESHERRTEFRVFSEPAHTVCASGKVTKNPETSVEEKFISLKDVFQRCRSIIGKGDLYEALARFGFRCSAPFRQLNDVFWYEDLKEAITTVKVKSEIAVEMHEYNIHPVVLDCFLQMVGILAAVTSKNKGGFLSDISSLTITRPLQEEMMIYVKTSNSTDNTIQFCGCFTDKHGSVLAELKGVEITFAKEAPKKKNDFLFENNWKEITSDQTMQNLPKAPRVVVFADKSGIAQQLKNYLHSESRFVTYQEWDKMLVSKKGDTNAQNKINLELQGYQDVLFMWGIQKLSESLPEKVVKHSVRCCEAFRQVVLELREKKSSGSVTIITYRTSEGKVDHINPGLALYGMSRTCMVEIPEITFQMVDISSTSAMDISALADVLVKYKAQDYPEVWIDEGRIYSSEIRRTPIEATASSSPSYPFQDSELYALYTADPYDTREVSAKAASSQTQLGNRSVEVQIEKISLHSEDYFPVTTSSCAFGKTLYWTSHTKDKHTLLALDFMGIVTATGIEVKKIKVGDHIAACYPVSATSRTHVPETVCFLTQKFPCFKNTPCVSFFCAARVILHQTLPAPKHGDVLGIISTEPESVLCKVLAFSAQELGWKTITTNQVPGLWQRVNQCNALIFLPPLTGMFKDGLSCLFHLKDVVLVYGNQQPDCSGYMPEMDHENIHIHTVNLIHIFQKAFLIRSQKEVYCWLKSMNMKQFKSLPYTLFQQAGVRSEDAASYFTCRSVPVAVLKNEEDESKVSDISMSETDRRLFKHNAVYLVTGGLSGLGLETVKFIAQNGGGRIIILSRSSPSAETQKDLKELQDHCEWSRVVSLQCNVTSSSEVDKAIKSIGKIFPNCPVKGVFHSAMVSHDGLLEVLTMSHFEEVLNPKVAGVINLHHALQGQELDHFVCYSCFSTFLGNPTQANDAAANSFLDLFCHYRRNRGLAGQSINWGALNLGAPEGQTPNPNNKLETRGVEELQVKDVHEYLRRCLILNSPQQAVVKFNFQTLAFNVLSQTSSLRSRFSKLASEEAYSNNSELTGGAVSQKLSLSGPVSYITSLLKTVSKPAPAYLSLHTPLSLLGIDSTVAFALKNQIFVETKVEIPLAKLIDPRSTVATLILHLKQNLNTAVSHGAEGVDTGSWL